MTHSFLLFMLAVKSSEDTETEAEYEYEDKASFRHKLRYNSSDKNHTSWCSCLCPTKSIQ